MRWAAHNVKFHRTDDKRFHHPLVGDLTLTYEAMELPADADRVTSSPVRPSRTPLHGMRSTSWPAGLPPPMRPSNVATEEEASEEASRVR